MRKVIVLFAALILMMGMVAGIAEEDGEQARFQETIFTTGFLGDGHAWVLDHEGILYQWGYDAQEPEQMGALPVVTSEMFLDYSRTYADLPAENQAQVDEAVTILAEDEDVLYALNHYAGRIGIVTENGVTWTGSFDSSACFLDDDMEAARFGALVMNHRLYLLLNSWDENSKILAIGLPDGEIRAYTVPFAQRMTPAGDELLILCIDEEDHAFLRELSPTDGNLRDLKLEVPGQGGLAYDDKTETIVIAGETGIYASKASEPFAMKMALPQNMAGEARFLSDGRYVVMGNGIQVMPLDLEENNTQVLRILTPSLDPALQGLFVSNHPDVLLDWREAINLTAGDIGVMIRGGEKDIDVFGLDVDGTFSGLTEGGFAAPLTLSRIQESVERMYPAIANCVTTSDGRIIAYPWEIMIRGNWDVNESLWRTYFPDEAYPMTWKEFFTLMLEFETEMYRDGDLFMTWWDYESMLTQVLSSYIRQQERDGLPTDFDTDELRETLVMLRQVQQALLDRGISTYDEGEIYWDSETIGDHSIFSQGVDYSSHSAKMGGENSLLPFTFAEGQIPTYLCSMRVMLVNQLSDQKNLAEDFIACLSEKDYSRMHYTLLHQDAKEPFGKEPYNVTVEDIEQWSNVAENIVFPKENALMTNDFTNQLQPLIAQYTAGQMDVTVFLQKLNDTAYMVERELQ